MAVLIGLVVRSRSAVGQMAQQVEVCIVGEPIVFDVVAADARERRDVDGCEIQVSSQPELACKVREVWQGNLHHQAVVAYFQVVNVDECGEVQRGQRTQFFESEVTRLSQ